MANDNIKLLEIIQKIAAEVVQANVPAGVCIGQVTSTDPLKIMLESKLEITEDSLILTKNTCEWSVDMTVDHHTELASGGSGDASYAPHKHGYLGKKTYLVHNGLATGDKVILLREEGGQRFIVLDRVYNPERGCSD